MISIGSHVYYTGAKTVVRTVYGNNNGFEDKAHQAPRFTVKSFAIFECHLSFIKRIQSCLTMGVVVCR